MAQEPVAFADVFITGLRREGLTQASGEWLFSQEFTEEEWNSLPAALVCTASTPNPQQQGNVAIQLPRWSSIANGHVITAEAITMGVETVAFFGRAIDQNGNPLQTAGVRLRVIPPGVGGIQLGTVEVAVNSGVFLYTREYTSDEWSRIAGVTSVFQAELLTSPSGPAVAVASAPVAALDNAQLNGVDFGTMQIT